MAYNEDFNIEQEDDLFGIDPDNSSDDSLLDEDTFTQTAVKPGTKTKDIVPASEEDKRTAKEKGKAESPEEKAKRLADEKAEVEAAFRKEAEDDWNSDPDDKTKPKQEDKTSGVEENSVDDNTLAEIAEGLYKANIFTKESEDETAPTTQEEFIEKFNREKEIGAELLIEEFASKHGEDYRKAFDAIFVDGVSPKEYLSRFEQIQSFKGMDLADEDNQVQIVKAALTKQGWEDEDIKEKIKSLKLNSELEADATRYHKVLVKTEERDLVLLQEKSKRELLEKQTLATQYSNSIHNILSEKLKTKDFDGIPVTKEVAQKTQDFLDNKKWKLPTGELITDFDYAILELNKPQNHETKVKLGLLLASVFQPGKIINLNLSPVKKAAVSQENKEIFNFNRNKKIKFDKQKETEDNPLKGFFD